MKKKDFVNGVVLSTGLREKQVRQVLQACNAIILQELRDGGCINVLGLGQLTLKARGERKARDMRRGGEVVVPAGAVMRFIPTKGVAQDLRATPLSRLAGAKQ